MTTNLRRLLALLVLLTGVAALTSAASAQVPPVLPTPTPSPSASPKPIQTPAPTPTPTRPGLPLPTDDPDPTEDPASASPEPSTSPELSPLPDGGPQTFSVPLIARTSARNTSKLMTALNRAVEFGIPIEEVVRAGFGRVPVGGVVYWSDDWWNARFTPVFHLHEGLDMFAEFGTPVRATDRGVVTRITNGAVGGLSVWTTGSDGTSYYFAHLQTVAAGIEAGTPVDVGTVVGTVGDSGNARGGAPHLHFEVHRPNAVPPKPFVDSWLDEAEFNVEALVDSLVSGRVETRRFLKAESAMSARVDFSSALAPTPEYAALLAVIDPVAAAVSVLPTTPLNAPTTTEVPSGLLRIFVRQRVEGGLISVGHRDQ